MSIPSLVPDELAAASSKRTQVESLAEFVVHTSFETLSPETMAALKIRVLDSLGTTIGALDAEPVTIVRRQIEDLGGGVQCALIGGGRSSPDRAALHNGALVRYLDFNDSYLASGETCHPSDNLAAVLAAAEYAGSDGRTLLTALAVAYQVQCRLSDMAPVRARGFDHTTHLAYAAAAGVARALGLDAAQTADAIAISGASLNALRVTRTGGLSRWKGLAGPWAAAGALAAVFLAKHGLTGPRGVFEGNKGFVEAISGPFEPDWASEALDAVESTVLKRYDAEIHSQSALEALLDLRAEHHLDAGEVERVELDTFQVAYDIIGGGEEGAKRFVRTKEEADHSLPYLLAVALLDGDVMPAQYRPERIAADDVQRLMARVEIRPDPELSRRFPAEHGARLRLRLRDGRLLERAKHDYHGFHTNPMNWDAARAKFDRLVVPRAGEGHAARLADVVAHLEELTVVDLTTILGLDREESP